MIFMPAPRFTSLTGIRLVEFKQGVVTAGGAASVTMPSNTDRVIVIAYMANGESSTNPPSISSFTTLASENNTSTYARFRLQYKVNPGVTGLLNSNDAGKDAAYMLWSFLGVDLADPFSAAATVAKLGGSGSGTPNPPSITPADDNSEVMIFGAVPSTTLSTGWASPSGYSDVIVQSAGEGAANNAIIMSARKTLATAAAENPAAFTNASYDSTWSAVSLALKPAS